MVVGWYRANSIRVVFKIGIKYKIKCNMLKYKIEYLSPNVLEYIVNLTCRSEYNDERNVI
jgi:hypothetical protein